MNADSVKNEAYKILQDKKGAILLRSKKLGSSDRFSIKKPLYKAMLRHNDPKFLENLCLADKFLRDKDIVIHRLIATLKYLEKWLDIENARAFKMFKETRVLVMALYYDKLKPFLENATIRKGQGAKDIINITISQELKVIAKNQQTITIQPQLITIDSESRLLSSVPLPCTSYSPSLSTVPVPCTSYSPSQLLSSVPVPCTSYSQSLSSVPVKHGSDLDMTDNAFPQFQQNSNDPLPSELRTSIFPFPSDCDWQSDLDDNIWGDYAFDNPQRIDQGFDF